MTQDEIDALVAYVQTLEQENAALKQRLAFNEDAAIQRLKQRKSFDDDLNRPMPTHEEGYLMIWGAERFEKIMGYPFEDYRSGKVRPRWR